MQDARWDCFQRGQTVRWKAAWTLATALWQHWDGLWTFVHVDGEPTNNTAERALRPAVLWRKGCFGTQSTTGSRFAERLLTVSATCRQQNTHLLSLLFRQYSAKMAEAGFYFAMEI